MAGTAIVGRLRKTFPHLQNGAHEAPAPGIVQIAKMPKEAAEGQPAIGLDHLDLRPAAEQMHFGRAGLQRGRGIVEGRSAGADHRNPFAAQAREVDRLRRMHAKRRRQMAQRLRNGPVAHALLPRRQHDLARKERIDAISGLYLRGEQSTGRRRNLDDLATIAHRQVHDAPEPEQIFRPKLARNQVELPPILLAEARLVPGLVGQARDIEVGPGEMLRAAQRVHAGIGEPRPLLPLLGFVEHKDVADLRAQQPKRRRETRLPGAHDEHVQCRPVVRSRASASAMRHPDARSWQDRREPGLRER